VNNCGLYDIVLRKEIVPCVYYTINDEPEFDDRYFCVIDYNRKGGLYDIELKKEIVPCHYSYVFVMSKNYARTVLLENKKLGVFNLETGKEIISCIYDAVDEIDGYIKICQGNQYGLFNSKGKEIIPIKYDMIDVSENLAVVKIDNKFGYIDINTGKVVIPIEYDNAQTFKDGVARVIKDGQTTLLKNPLKEGNAIALAQAPSVKKDPNAPAVSRYPAPNSDVDKDIPQVKTNESSNLFAFIIANENYPEAPVPFALNDGRIFKEYCLKTLGLPEKHIRLFEDATVGKIIAAIEQIKEVADAYDGEAEIILYYAGHGVPDEKKNTAYLLPVDGSSSDITTTGYSLEKLYAELGKLNLKSITVFLDACFSGAKREDEMLASARGVAVKVKDEAPKGNMVVFSAATGDETAHQYEEKGHGLFTYFLLKKLQETQGNVNFGELSDYVTKQVKRQSVVINNKRQTPTVIPSISLSDKWQGMKLK